jgi:predicted nucleic acid-binding protein
VILIDSCGWVELLSGTRLGEAYRPALSDPRGLLVPTVCIADVAQSVLRHHTDPVMSEAVALMTHEAVVPLDVNLAIEAARLGNACRLPSPLNVILTTALRYGAEVWTHDERLRKCHPVRFMEDTG